MLKCGMKLYLHAKREIGRGNKLVRIGSDKLIAAAIAVAVLLVAGAAAFAFWPDSDAGSRADVQPRGALAEYSWEELSAISREISSCGDQDEAVRCAARYGLCQEDGAIDPEQVKAVSLANGTTVRVVLAGVWHDARTDGGKAGLTFAFADAAGQHAMNHAFEDAEGDMADSAGGWAASDMRAWLNGDFLRELPAELRGCIVSAQKRVASYVDAQDESVEAGHLAGTATDWVGETSDKLWLFSAAELCGSVPENEAMGIEETMAAVYAGEGEQYPLFAQSGVAAFAPNELLVRTQPGEQAACTWWLRTKMLEFGDGFWLVGTDGTPLNGLGEDARIVEDPEYAPDELWGPDHARGVVVGFCL